MPIAINYITDIISKAKSAIADLSYKAVIVDYQGDNTEDYHHKIGILSDGIRTFENQIDVFIPGTYIITTDQELKILHLMIEVGNLNNYFVRSFTRESIVVNSGNTFLKLTDTPDSYPLEMLIPVINATKDGLIFQPMSALLPPAFFDLINKIISGCSFAFDGTNKLKVNVADGVYRIGSVDYTFNASSIVLSNGDAVHGRLDAVVLDINGLSVIAGIPAYTPATPTIPHDVLLLSYILVAAGSTTTGSPGLTDSGDLIGVNLTSLDNTVPVVHMVVGTAKKYQFFAGSITFNKDHIINLPRITSTTSPNTHAKEGNSFTIHLKGAISSGIYKLMINQDYTDAGSPGTTLKTFTKDELDYISLARTDGLYVTCTFTGSDWILATSTEVETLYDIVMFAGDCGLSNFTVTGLGVGATPHEGYALCNGSNGTPNLIDRFIKAGATPGTIGGTNSYATGIPIVNLPVVAPWLIGNHTHSFSGTTGGESQPHTHNLSFINLHSAGGTGEPNIMASDGSDTVGPTTTNSVGHTHSYSGTTSNASSISVADNAAGGQAFDNQPAFYTLAFKMRISVL